jgi:hypothetical protein
MIEASGVLLEQNCDAGAGIEANAGSKCIKERPSAMRRFMCLFANKHTAAGSTGVGGSVVEISAHCSATATALQPRLHASPSSCFVFVSQ